MRRRAFEPAISAIVLIMTHSVALATVTLPAGRFGMTVVVKNDEVIVSGFEQDAPISKKLAIDDILIRYTKTGNDAQVKPFKTARDVVEVAILLSQDEKISIEVSRLTRTGNTARRGTITIKLDISDLKSPKRLLEERTSSYTVSVPHTEEPAIQTPERVEHSLVDVLYATDRTLENNQYSKHMDLGELPVKYGVCRVSIPKEKGQGKIPRPTWWPGDWYENPDKHVSLRSVQQFNGREFFVRNLAARLEGEGRKNWAFVYVHGYRNSFQDAALRTAQMHYDLGFKGVSCFFSWPSDAEYFAYKRDEEDMEVSQPHIADFLETICDIPNVDAVFVLAHSMGNRGVTKALAKLISDNKHGKIKELILAAPDINAEVFNRQIAPQLANLRRITVYASQSDVALQASQRFSSYPRAGSISGDGRPFINCGLFRNLDVCDTTGAAVDFIGHGSFGDSPSLLDDLWEVITNGTDARNRRMLIKADPSMSFFHLKSN